MKLFERPSRPLEGDAPVPAIFCLDGPALCRVRVLSAEQWEALAEVDRPLRAAHVRGLGWIVASPVEHLN